MKFLLPILLVGTSVAAFFLFIDPQYKEAKGLRAAIAKYDEVLITSNEVKKKKTELVEADKLVLQRNNGKDSEKMKKMIPQRIESIKFILDMSDLARQHGLNLKNIQVSAGGATAGGDKKTVIALNSQPYKTNSFAFGVTTTYQTFLAFLRDLERNLQIMDVGNITFNSSDTNIYDFSIGGTIYSLE